MNELAVLDLILEQELDRNPDLVFLATSTPPSWRARFGAERVRTCPISEPAMVGAALGAAMTGLRPVVDLNRASFAFLVMDQLVNHAARIHYLSDGSYRAPMVLTSATRGPQQLGPQNEQCPYGVFMQTPGVRVAVPGSATDACALLRTAVRDEQGPVLLFIAPGLADHCDLRAALAAGPQPFGVARRVREGDAATVVAIGSAVHAATRAGDELAAQGIHVELLDPRTLVPLDVPALAASVLRTGRLVLVDDGPRSGAPAQILAALLDVPGVAQALGGRIAHVSAPEVPVPSSPVLEAQFWATPERVAAAVRRLTAAA